MREYIVTFDGINNSPNTRGELTRCRDCAFYGIAKPNYCGIIRLFIPEESYCSFAQESKWSKVGNGKPITARSIQRSITKACARHGLGLKIYAGEDLPPDKPETVDVPKINRVTAEQGAQLEKELQRTGVRWNPATVKADLDVKTWEHYMSVLRAKPDKEAEV